jgi:type IV secretory pathway TraG/TraD family ATPase VirD4
MSLDQYLKRIDARYRIPRPADALHLDSFQAAFHLMRDVGEGVVLVACGITTAFLLWHLANVLLRVGLETHDYMLIAMPVALLVSAAEALSLAVPYYRLTQRLTHGSARWADVGTLKDLKLAHDKRWSLPSGTLKIGRLTRRHDLTLPLNQVLRHTAIFGPPGAGKSATFFMSIARDWAKCGSAIFLDPKGELYGYTKKYFKRVYRLDLADPRHSDRWNPVPACKGDAELAHEVASIITGYDPNKHSNYDPFWQQAETALATALLLHLPHLVENATPAQIAEFIASRDLNKTDEEMSNSPDLEARIHWGLFKKADREKTQGGVFVGLGVKLDPFRSPHALAVLQSATSDERARGLREIDLYDLRKPGTAIYVVIPEGDATRYKIVLSILFGLVANVARKTSHDESGAPVLLALDEAGNIPLHNLSEILGVGRGRRFGMVLGYQNVGQLYKQHGRDGALAILGSIGTQVFLPGLDSETAQYAVKRIGRTTVLQHTSVDAPGSVYDNERYAEAGRDLIDPAELRQMAEYTQGVAIIASAPPVKFGFPECAKEGKINEPELRELAVPVTLAEAEKAAREETMGSKQIAPADGKSPSESGAEQANPAEGPPPSESNFESEGRKNNDDDPWPDEDVEVSPRDPAVSPLAGEKLQDRQSTVSTGPSVVIDVINARINEKERRSSMPSAS